MHVRFACHHLYKDAGWHQPAQAPSCTKHHTAQDSALCADTRSLALKPPKKPLTPPPPRPRGGPPAHLMGWAGMAR